ncbi:MAG: bis(5'-nucleosyl)-tetraphosphatase (symmetrical) YqeK [Coriobacteriales bacterium]
MKEDKKQFQRYVDAVDARLSGRRLKHVHSVSEFAAKMARAYGVSEYDARVAGLLHDWDKLLTDEEFPARMEELGVEPPENVELMWPVIHSFTGAKAVEREFPELEPQIISAIWKHTLGGIEMSPLDMVIFIADMIEPNRKAYNRPYAAELREQVGKMPLEDMYFEAYKETMISLATRKRFIHPIAFEIWNHLVLTHNPHPGAGRQGDPDVVL